MEKQSRTSNIRLSGVQALILIGLTLAVMCVMGALIISVMANYDLLFGASPPKQRVAQSTLSTTLTPTPTPSVLPVQTATSTPSPPTATPTMVVPPDLINRDKINEIIAYIANIRGLEPLQDVPSRFLTRAELRRHLETGYAEAGVSSALDRNRELYVALDLLDPVADFEAIVLDSAAQNIAGFYTPHEQVLYLVAESVNMFASEEIVYAHEYTHALQDHHFDLIRFLSEDQSADQAIASRALVEGDATLLKIALRNLSELVSSHH